MAYIVLLTLLFIQPPVRLMLYFVGSDLTLAPKLSKIGKALTQVSQGR